MKYIEELQKKKVFGRSFAEQLTGNVMSAKSMLQSYKKAGYITSIRRDLYAALDLATKNVLASRFEIACAISESAYLSHHSALEYHGISNQVFYTVTVTSKERFTAFTFDGVTYEQYQPRITGGVTTPPQTPLVSVTDIERTIVDCIYDIGRAGGLEELVEALRLLPGLNENKVLAYLEEYNQIFLWQKAGYMLEQFARELSISEDFFAICKGHVNQRKRYLTDDAGLIYHPDWKLYAPKNLLGILEDGGDELV